MRTYLRRALLLIVVLLAALVPVASAQAYLNQSECRSALMGGGGTDNDYASVGQYFWPNTYSFWGWGYYNRYSNNRMRQDIVYNSGNTTGLHDLVFICDDSNGSGQLSWSEDYYNHQWAY